MTRSGRTVEDVRRDIESERERLATAAEDLRESFDITGRLRAKLPVVAAGAVGLGFFLAGGVGATARLLTRGRARGR